MLYIPSPMPSPAPSSADSLPAGFTSETTAPSSGAEEKAEPVTITAKKKKKKKSKRSGKKLAGTVDAPVFSGDVSPVPPCLLSRNKHMRYISSYQGSWLQLPIELLDSLLTLNLEPLPLYSPEQHTPSSRKGFISGLNGKQRAFERSATPSSSDHTPPDSPPLFSVTTPLLDTFPEDLPPPIDPGVFRSVINIRRLVEEATSLTVRANSGLSAAALGSMQMAPNANASPWALAQSLGINPLGDPNPGNGRKSAMSATRIHRLRVLAVQKLAAAYRHDEIAASVMTMQSGSVFDDLADRVLKVDPHHSDALYVNHFHEKIPSRQVAEFTTTDVLDGLIANHPHCSEYYRTRGIVYTFREEYAPAIRDFTHVLNQARSARKAQTAHAASSPAGRGGKKKKASAQRDVDVPPPHPTKGEDAPEPIELQALFLRGSTYIQYATSLVESKALSLEGVKKTFLPNGQDLRLAEPLPDARYGGVEADHPDGPLGPRDGAKASAYRDALLNPQLRQQVFTLARKSIRDAERFLTHFGALDPHGPGSGVPSPEDIPERVAYSYALSAALRPGVRASLPTPPSDLPRPAVPPPYHPLLVEAHFIILLGHLLLGDFTAVLHGLMRAARVIEVLEGGPIFLPPRSLAQAEVVEILERLAGCWENGTRPSSQALTGNGKGAAPTIPAPFIESGQRSSSSTPFFTASGSSSSSTFMPTSPLPETPATRSLLGAAGLYGSGEECAAQLDAARMLLAAVVTRQNAQTPASSPQLSIPLYGPRVEIVLAWLGAVWIPALD
ncbi:hypothetical protein PENSPDRAFT_757425 [Peniophora sp. CONT]|nr:hypothetical protein PENSPDRAFT_757425 [Peniophora sp. CONT]